MRRGETVEVSSPSVGPGGGPRLRERPLGRCHTLDSGEETPEQPPEPTNTTENTPQESKQTAVTHTRNEAAETSETHSADDCSSACKTPLSPAADAPSHDEKPSAAQTSDEPSSQGPRPLNGQPSDHDTGNPAAPLSSTLPPTLMEAMGETPAERQERAQSGITAASTEML